MSNQTEILLCAPSEPYNPKTDRRNKTRCSSFGSVCEPIKREIKDLDKAQYGYSQYPIVPFLDDSDATLGLLNRLRTYSPTHASCIDSIKMFAFGGQLTATVKKIAGFAQRPADQGREISDEQFASMVDFIEGLNPGFSGDEVLQISEALFENMASFGNMFLRCDRWTVGSQRYFSFHNIDAEMCRYWATEDDENKVILISPLWTLDYLSKYPPEFVSAYPNWSEGETGVESTIIHIKENTIGRDWYGLPSSIGSLYYQYMENQLGEYSTTGYAKRWTGQKFFETEGDPEDEDPDNTFVDALDDLFTNEGQAKTWVHRYRRRGDEPTKIHEFEEDKSHEFHNSMADMAERQIIKSHKWHKVLLGVPTSGRLGQSNEFAEIFKHKYKTVIRPWQTKIADTINKALGLAGEWTGNTITNEVALDFGNMFADILEATVAEETGEIPQGQQQVGEQNTE